MFVFIVRRVLNLIPTFLLATFLAWFVIEIAPGDFASQFAFDQVDPNKAQRIREFAGPRTPILCPGVEGEPLFTTLEELLPHSFGPEFLGRQP